MTTLIVNAAAAAFLVKTPTDNLELTPRLEPRRSWQQGSGGFIENWFFDVDYGLGATGASNRPELVCCF